MALNNHHCCLPLHLQLLLTASPATTRRAGNGRSRTSPGGEGAGGGDGQPRHQPHLPLPQLVRRLRGLPHDRAGHLLAQADPKHLSDVGITGCSACWRGECCGRRRRNSPGRRCGQEAWSQGARLVEDDLGDPVRGGDHGHRAPGWLSTGANGRSRGRSCSPGALSTLLL